MKIPERAYAKANLYLDVTGLRADGYHGIESVMVTLPFYDVVSVEDADVVTVALEGRVSSDLEDLPQEKNLAYRAAWLFFEKSGISGGAKITIEKKIPSRAGLGGGSADAASALRALNSLYGEPFSRDELIKISLPLGADVPFCVAGGAALCRGIGEIMTPIDSKIELHGVVTSERAEKRSTADAYRAVDLALCSIKKTGDAASMARAMEAGDFDSLCKNAYNVFGEAGLYPEDARNLLKGEGAPFVLMSGAGPSVVALTATAKDAEKNHLLLLSRGFSSILF